MQVPEHRIRMRERRVERCLSLDQAAAEMGIARNTLRRIEYGQSGRLSTRLRIASYYDDDVRELFPELFRKPIAC